MAEQLTEQQVRHVAKLSRLRFDDQQIHQFTEQLSAVLDYVSKLNELDVTGVEPLSHAVDLVNVLRQDAQRQGFTAEQAIANAPDSDPPFFKVPKVLGEGSGA